LVDILNAHIPGALEALSVSRVTQLAKAQVNQDALAT
jgi:hypothetical protein